MTFYTALFVAALAVIVCYSSTWTEANTLGSKVKTWLGMEPEKETLRHRAVEYAHQAADAATDAAETGKQYAQQGKKAAQHMGEQAMKAGKEYAHQAADAATDAAETGKQYAQQGKKTAQHMGEQAMKAGKEYAHQAMDTAVEYGAAAVDAASKAADQVLGDRTAAEFVKEHATRAASASLHYGKIAADQAMDIGAKAAHVASEYGQVAAEHAAKHGAHAAHVIGEQAKVYGHKAAEVIGDKIHDLQNGGLDDAKETAAAALETAKVHAAHLYEAGKSAASTAADKAQEVADRLQGKKKPHTLYERVHDKLFG